MRHPTRSILAVIAGFLTMAVLVIVLTLITVKLTHLQSGHPTRTYLILNVAYSMAAALLGGYVTARIARYNCVAHGVVLAAVMLVLNAIALRHPAPGQPMWYQVLLTLVPPVLAIAGAATVKPAPQLS